MTINVGYTIKRRAKDMKIKFLAHASFLITSDSGTRIITDPYATSPQLNYVAIKERADIVTISHGHFDHNNAAAVQGNPVILDKPGQTSVKGIEFRGIAVYHDDKKGQARGSNIIFCFEVDGVKVCHLGDLGHSLDDKQIAEVGKVDVLFIPVGGFFTIDARAASEVSHRIGAKFIIPMHYLTGKIKLPISGVEDFLKDKKNTVRQDSGEIEIKSITMPASPQVVVLKPALG
jgi:L-ascorbate metabolism protein UlaG (beta-lactamase superfamily)